MSLMDLEVIDCALDGSSTSSAVRNAAAMLPSAEGKEQKMVIGDKAGVVTSLRLLHPGDPQEVFKTTPAAREVTALTLGGPRAHKDKIYVAFGHKVVGINKKGKEFFTFNTSLHEDIRHLFVDNLTIWTAGEFVLNRFENCIDSGFFMSNDVINHFSLEFDVESTAIFAILACQDKCVRVVSGSELVDSMALDAPVTFIMPYPTKDSYWMLTTKDSSKMSFSVEFVGWRRIMYGTERGAIGHLLLGKGGKLQSHSQTAVRSGAVTTMAHGILTDSATPDVIVGYDTGLIEVFRWENDTLVSVYQRSLSESIMSVCPGHVTCLNKTEVVVVTYSGRVIILRQPDTDPLNRSTGARQFRLSRNISFSTKQELTGIGNETEEMPLLLKMITKELEAKRIAYKALSSELVAVETQFHVQKSFRLDPEKAAFTLAIEIEMPIDVIGVCSSTPVMLLSSSVISSITPTIGELVPFVATFRCVDSCNRVEIQLRTTEGQTGSLSVYVLPRLYPKTAQLVTIPIKPLSLHENIGSIPPQWKFPNTTLTFSGQFSLNQVHAWICSCLPDVPANNTAAESILFFRSTFLDTYLTCKYRKGEAIFISDSCSTISIIREHISKEATSTQVSFSIGLEMNPECATSLIDRIKPKIEYYSSLTLKHSKIAALKEIQTQEGERCDFLSREYLEILSNADQIESELAAAPRHLDFLRTVIVDLFTDSAKLLGRSPASKLPRLHETLKDFKYEQMMEMFRSI